MTVGSFVIIQDLTTSSALFGGSPLYIHCNEITISGKNNLGIGTRAMIENGIISADRANEPVIDAVRANLDRRKGLVSYTGFENPKIIMRGGWADIVGSEICNETGNMLPVLTPAKFWHMVHSDHQFFIRGASVAMLADIFKGDTGSQFYDETRGIPLAIETWSMKEDVTGRGRMTWQINSTEDKDEELN